jgi:hypothetical protein
MTMVVERKGDRLTGPKRVVARFARRITEIGIGQKMISYMGCTSIKIKG